MSRNAFPEYKSVVEGVLNRLCAQGAIINYDPQQLLTMLEFGLTPIYIQQDDFTVCMLENTQQKVVAVGVSKRNPIDQKLLLRGRALALSRAVREFVVKALQGRVTINEDVTAINLTYETPVASA